MSKDKPAETWGLSAAEFYAELQGQVVQVAIAVSAPTGSGLKLFQGTLVGVDRYDLVLRQETGLRILFNKGHLVYVTRAPGGAPLP